jgi:hypothetical protein
VPTTLLCRECNLTRTRRLVATDLASSTRSGRPTQMIVATCEHTLARHLTEDLPDTHLHYIKRTEILDLPPQRSAPLSDEAHGESA